MAKKSMILKQQAPAKFSTRKYNRCKLCGRPHAYLRDYGVCRICFRTLVIFYPHTSLAQLGVHKVRHRLAASSENKISTRRTPAESVALRRTHVPKSRKAPVIQDGERSLVIKHRQCAADGLNYQ